MKKLTTFFLFILLGYSLFIKAQTPSWEAASGAGGIFSEEGTAIATSASGTSTIVGFFSSPICAFDSINLTNISFTDIFIARYNQSNNVVWAKGVGGLGEERATSVAMDNAENVYVVGYFNSTTLVFDTITLTNIGGYDMFIAKYNSAGGIVWAKNIGGTSADYANSITVDNYGRCLITGYFHSPSVNFGSTTLLNPNASLGGYGYFVTRLNQQGNVEWAKTADGSKVAGNSIATDNSGGIFVSGAFMGNVIFDSISKSSNGSKDVFVAKLDTMGNIVWVNTFGGTNEEVSNAVCIDGNSNCILTGYFKSYTIIVGSTTLTNSGIPDGDVFIVKYDNAGNTLWAKKAMNYSNDMGLAIVADASGNSYTSGYYNGSSLGFDNITLNSAGANTSVGDFFVVKYNSNGAAVWAKNLQSNTGSKGQGIALDSLGNCYLTGFYEDVSISFDNITLTNAGNQGQRDVFIGKIGNTTTVGFSENSNANNINLMPNPFTDILYWEYTGKHGNGMIHITDILGNNIQQEKIDAEMQHGKIDLSSLAPGVYVIQHNNSGILTTKKIIKQ
ncbi:MAG: T9SS type A sorting domain-containing protein [Bacteroidia bacterium]|nr:T9SS type A sorting domain-containing protein [Bacteroidia bacterium]